LTVGAGGVLIFDPSVAASAVSHDGLAAVPEPGMLGLFATGGVCIVAARFLRRRYIG
jgi:hypothetical protein